MLNRSILTELAALEARFEAGCVVCIDLIDSYDNVVSLNWTGGGEFIETVRPKLFVTMHAFGNTASVGKFAQTLKPSNTKIFEYAVAGDSRIYEV